MHLRAALTMLAVLVAGCASGPSDTVAPSIVERAPAPGSDNVWIGAPIDVVFSEPMRADRIDAESVFVTNGAGAVLATTAVLSGDGTRLRLVLDERPETLPVVLTVTVTSDLTDLAGNALVVPETAHSWEVPAWQQLGGALDRDGTNDAVAPVVTVDGAGGIVVAWHEGASGAPRDVYASRWDEEHESWTPLGGALDTQASADALEPTIAVDDQGRPVVAWRESGPNHWVPTRRWAEGAWQVVDHVDLGVTPTLELREPAIATNAAGGLATAFVVDFDTDPAFLLAASWDETASDWVRFAGGTPPSRYGHDAVAPALLLLADERAVVAWQEPDLGGVTNVYVALAGLGSPTWAWLAADGVNTPGWSARDAALVLGGNGQPIIAWRELQGGSGSNYDLRVAAFDVGSTSWIDLGTGALDVDPANSTGEPALIVDASGRPVVAWHENDGGNRSVHVHRWSATTATWGQLGDVLDADPSRSAYEPQLAIDASGAPVVVWHESVDGAFSVFAKRWNGR